MDFFENIVFCNFFFYDICGMGINFFLKYCKFKKYLVIIGYFIVCLRRNFIFIFIDIDKIFSFYGVINWK